MTESAVSAADRKGSGARLLRDVQGAAIPRGGAGRKPEPIGARVREDDALERHDEARLRRGTSGRWRVDLGMTLDRDDLLSLRIDQIGAQRLSAGFRSAPLDDEHGGHDILGCGEAGRLQLAECASQVELAVGALPRFLAHGREDQLHGAPKMSVPGRHVKP